MINKTNQQTLLKSKFADILSSKYEFNSDEYAKLINEAIFVDLLDDALIILNKMADSNDYSIIFALSFVLEHANLDFVQSNKNQIADIITKAASKNYQRANFYFSEIFQTVLERNIDYQNYLDLFIKSNDADVQNKSIEQLIFLSTHQIQQLTSLSNSIDLSYFHDDFNTLKNKIKNLNIQTTSLTQKKIIAICYLKYSKDRTQSYKIFKENNPELFDFIFFCQLYDN